MRPIAFLVLALPVAVAGANAQSGAGSARDAVGALDELATCGAIAADAQRLACYDRIARSIATARQSGDLLAFDRKVVTKEQRTQFGLVDGPADASVGAGAQAAARAVAVREITSTITGVSQGAGFGRWNLRLANGQLWQTMEENRYGPRAGASIRIVTTVTGGFRASLDGARLAQVKRVR